MRCGENVLRDVSFVSLKENDYIESYFDNGEDFAADSDDNMDGEATYWGHVAYLNRRDYFCLLFKIRQIVMFDPDAKLCLRNSVNKKCQTMWILIIIYSK